MPTSFQNIEETGKIRVEIGVWVFQRVTDAGLCGKMHDGSERAVAENSLHRLAIGKIDLVEGEVAELA